MIGAGPEVALWAVGTALAGLSVAFASYMLAYGEGKVRVNGIEHLDIFAQPRGGGAGAPSAPVDLETTGSLAPQPAFAGRPEIVAAGADRVWLRIGGSIRAAGVGETVPGVGRIAAIVPRNGGWALLNDEGETLFAVAKGSNGAALFGRKMIFE
jgi:hypothetical protein